MLVVLLSTIPQQAGWWISFCLPHEPSSLRVPIYSLIKLLYDVVEKQVVCCIVLQVLQLLGTECFKEGVFLVFGGGAAAQG
jgi:hypothetical protein